MCIICSHFGKNKLSGEVPAKLFSSRMTLLHVYVLRNWISILIIIWCSISCITGSVGLSTCLYNSYLILFIVLTKFTQIVRKQSAHWQHSFYHRPCAEFRDFVSTSITNSKCNDNNISIYEFLWRFYHISCSLTDAWTEICSVDLSRQT